MAVSYTHLDVYKRQMQTGETDGYRVYCYFRSTPVRNFELFYVELDGGCANTSIGHTDKAQEYIYIISGELVIHTEIMDYTLHEGEAFVFDSSISHTYINQQEMQVTFMVVNYYPH